MLRQEISRLTSVTTPDRTASEAPRQVETRQAEVSLRLQLLGQFCLAVDGRELEVPHAVERLIAFLALQERRIHRLAVAGRLWIDSSDESAGASLRTALWRLAQLSHDVVGTEGAMLELAGGVVVDFRHAEARASLLLEHPEEYCDHDLELLGTARELLPDWYDDWLFIKRERFRQLRLHALESLCRAFSAAGAHADAVRAGLTAVGVEPLRESSHRALISAYAAEGNVSEAMRHYGLYTRHLAEELGIGPSPRMEMLIVRLRSPVTLA
jgi:DNA-binding SARP family transcriptional activator